MRLIEELRALGCDVVNRDGALTITGETARLPADLIAQVRAIKLELSSLLAPAMTFPGARVTVRAPVDQPACQDCGAVTMIMLRFGDETFCRSCLIGELPALLKKPANCAWCGLRVVKTEGHFVASRDAWYCSKIGCYKEHDSWKRKRAGSKSGKRKSTRKNGTSVSVEALQIPSATGPTEDNRSSCKTTPIALPAPSKTEPFNRRAVEIALAERKYSFEIDGEPTHVSGARWNVPVRTRVIRKSLGVRSVVIRNGVAMVEPGTYQDGLWYPQPPDAPETVDYEIDPLGGGAWERK